MEPVRITAHGLISQKQYLKKTGKTTKVVHVSTAQYQAAHPESADRPAYSVLDNYMFRLVGGYTFADWESALDEYLEENGFA